MKTILITAALFLTTLAEGHAIKAPKGNQKKATFDIVQAEVKRQKGFLEFTMEVSGRAGQTRPTPGGKLAGAEVFSYVWPTSLDSSVVGFDEKQGIVALAVTSHPDFDDTPLFMRTETDALITTATSGTPTGWFWSPMIPAAKAS